MSPRLPPKISSRHDWTKEVVQKLIDNRKKKLLDNRDKKLLDSQEEKLLDKQNSSNQPNQSQNQSVIDHVLQIDQGNLISRLAWLEFRQICLEKSELSKLTIDQGNLINMKSHYE